MSHFAEMEEQAQSIIRDMELADFLKEMDSWEFTDDISQAFDVAMNGELLLSIPNSPCTSLEDHSTHLNTSTPPFCDTSILLPFSVMSIDVEQMLQQTQLPLRRPTPGLAQMPMPSLSTGECFEQSFSLPPLTLNSSSSCSPLASPFLPPLPLSPPTSFFAPEDPLMVIPASSTSSSPSLKVHPAGVEETAPFTTSQIDAKDPIHSCNYSSKEYAFLAPVSALTFQHSSIMDPTAPEHKTGALSPLPRKRGRPPLVRMAEYLHRVHHYRDPSMMTSPTPLPPSSVSPSSASPFLSSTPSSSISLSPPPCSNASGTDVDTTGTASLTLTSTTYAAQSPTQFYIMKPYKHTTAKIDRRSFNSRKELKHAQAKANAKKRLSP